MQLSSIVITPGFYALLVALSATVGAGIGIRIHRYHKSRSLPEGVRVVIGLFLLVGIALVFAGQEDGYWFMIAAGAIAFVLDGWQWKQDQKKRRNSRSTNER